MCVRVSVMDVFFTHPTSTTDVPSARIEAVKQLNDACLLQQQHPR